MQQIQWQQRSSGVLSSPIRCVSKYGDGCSDAAWNRSSGPACDAAATETTGVVNTANGVAAEAAVEYTAAQYDVPASVETDAVMATRMRVVAACDAAATETTGVVNAANGVAAEAAVEYTAAQYDVPASVETDAMMVTRMGVVAACDAAATETTGVVNAANGVAAEAAVEYTAAQYDVSASVETDEVSAIQMEVVAACDAAAIETTGVVNAANGVAAGATVEYTAAQYDVSASMETDAMMSTRMEVVAACDAAATETTGVINATNGVAPEAAMGYTAAQYDVSTTGCKGNKEKMRSKLRRQKKRNNKAFKARSSDVQGGRKNTLFEVLVRAQ